MKEKTCCFTGHREIPFLSVPIIKKRLKKEITQLIEQGYTTFVSGGAIGFDTLAAKIVLNMKKDNPNISLRMILPCEDQDKFWNSEQKKDYRRILEDADLSEFICMHYTPYCMFQRNKKMVDVSSVVIAFYDGGEKGGTAMTVKYAKQKNIRTINIFEQN